MKIKVSKLASPEFLAAFKALCNIPVKDHKANWQLALSHAAIRSAGKTREEAVQSVLESCGESLDGRTFSFKTAADRKTFTDSVKGIDAQEVDLPLKAKVKLSKDEFSKLNAEQLGELLDLIEPPAEALD